MQIKSEQEFRKVIQSFPIQTEYVIVKPNWINIRDGEYTDKIILEWLFKSLPQKKIVIESYTPWRGLEYSRKEELATDLEKGKEYWDYYKEQDNYFLEKTGIGELLEEFDAKYINITNEAWSNRCIPSKLVGKIAKVKKWDEFYSYIPQSLYDIKDNSTFISLAKIKTETKIDSIIVSLSLKNLFGLIPHPSRIIPFHGDNHQEVPIVIADIFRIYSTLFPHSLWINEGIFSLVNNYQSKNQTIIKNQGHLFIDTDPIKADSVTCQEFGIDPQKVPYLTLYQ